MFGVGLCGKITVEIKVCFLVLCFFWVFSINGLRTPIGTERLLLVSCKIPSRKSVCGLETGVSSKTYSAGANIQGGFAASLLDAGLVNQYCLGLRKSGSLTNDLKNMAFLGDNLLSHKFVLYDIENEAIGWTPYDCFSSVGVQDENSTTVYEVHPHHVYAPLRETSAARSRDRSVMIYLAIILSLLLILKFR